VSDLESESLRFGEQITDAMPMRAASGLRRAASGIAYTAAMLCSLLITLRAPAQQRVASDFEIAQMEKQLATARDFSSQISGHLNLGDARLSRNEPTLATAEYELAVNVATNERLNARRASEMARYATATAYEGLAAAKLGDAARAFTLLEEAIRYTSDSAKTWNLYSTAMGLLGKSHKAVSASRNAVAIAQRGHDDPLDLAVYEYALAAALGDTPESEQLLREVVVSLRSPSFDSLRRQIVHGEQFEIYSSARGETAAYLSLLDRSQLRLAQLDELHGDRAHARQEYQGVLTTRSDDPIALAALARLAPNDAERERAFADAFDANPFSLPLIREFQKSAHGNVEGDSTGAAVRRALVEMQRDEWSAARTRLDALLAKFPANETLRTLRAEAEPQTGGLPKTATPSAAELRAVMALFAHITPEQRAALDAMTFNGTALFSSAGDDRGEGQTVFEGGAIDSVPFKFAEPTAFRGTFGINEPLRLTYRILGATTVNGADGLLLEPLALEQVTKVPR
jgi:hypothetical protein